MGYLEVAHLSVVLPNGRILFDDVTFRVADGARVALVGANGSGKTTLLRVAAGDRAPNAGTVTHGGGLGVMRQFVGSIRDQTTVRELLLRHAQPALRAAGERLERAEFAMVEHDDESSQLRYAEALANWGDAGGYLAEVLWDTVTVAALGVPFDQAQHRMVRTLSGGEQKRLVAEVLLRGPDQVLLLDEPDNYLDVPGKRWLEERLVDTHKTVLFVSHDRELLARTATRVVTVEGHSAWVHGGGFDTYRAARTARVERLDELHRRWNEEHQRLRDLVRTLQQQARSSPDMASRYHAMQTRLARFEAAGPPPERPVEQRVSMRLRWRSDRGARVDVPRSGTDRADAPVRPGGVLLRARGGTRFERFRQVALPAPAGWWAGAAPGRVEARRPGGTRAVRADPRPSRVRQPAPGGHPLAR